MHAMSAVLPASFLVTPHRPLPPALPTGEPALGVVALRSLRDGDGAILVRVPTTVVSLHAQVRFEGGFGRIASGPLAALFLPAGSRVRPEPGIDLSRAWAFALAGAPGEGSRREVLPSRSPIDAATFDALYLMSLQAPAVRRGGEDAAARHVLDWMAAQALARGATCHGYRNSRTALRNWGERVSAAEDALQSLDPRQPLLASELPAPLQDPAFKRRFCRVTGYGPRRYLYEYRQRLASIALRAGRG